MKFPKLVLMFAGGFLITVTAKAEEAQFDNQAVNSHVQMRCEEDSLNPKQARARLNWAKDNKVIKASVIRRWMYEFDEDWQPVLSSLPLYPIFGTWDGNIDNTRFWKPEDHEMPSEVPSGVVWIGTCRASCYTPEQLLLTDTGYMPIIDALNQSVSEIITVAPGSDFGRLRFKASRVGSYTASIRDTKHDILTFRMLSGGSLRVTPNHPVVDSEGIMREARSFNPGDSLVRVDGNFDPIVSISEGETFFGKVYNVMPAGRNLKENIVVVQGYLNGSSRYQNSFLEKLNRQILYEQMDEALLPQ